MLLQAEDNIKLSSDHAGSKYRELLGFLPVLDTEEHSYYSVKNYHKNAEYERVSPVCGWYDQDFLTELECWFANTMPPGAREKLALYHEFYRDEFLERVERCKYCVMFEGCDDGDKFMRFESKGDALEFFKNIDFFDEIVSHPLCQSY